MKLNLSAKCDNQLDLSSELREFGHQRTFNKGDVIYNKGDKSSGLYYIEKGLVGLINLSPNGNESLLRIFGHKFFFGYRSLLPAEDYHATSVALTDVTITYFPFKSGEEVLEQYPEIVLHLAKVLSRDLRISEERFNDITGKRVASRIIESLIFLKHRHPNYQWTRREIGEFCGAKTETVTRALTKLEKEGLIQKEGREIHIVNPLDLLSYAENLEMEL
jgi:CRP-like cAMP-binding protein